MIFKTFIFLFTLLIPVLADAQQPEHTSVSLTDEVKSSELKIDRSHLITPIMLRDDVTNGFSPLHAVRNKAGFAFAGSAVLPGASQAAHGNWFRAGLYFAVEIATLYTHLEYMNRGRRGERNYEQFADQNWSVVQYANWIVDYHNHHNLSNPYLDQLEAMMNGHQAAFEPSVDWQVVDIDILRNVERNTPYMTTDELEANNFSHELPGYGSQQYYELISKYYQYSAGWSDFYTYHMENETNPFLIDRLGGKASPLFWTGRNQAAEFNDHYRFSKNMLSLLILNHFISAFDAYFTIRLQNREIEAGTSGTPGMQFRLTYRF